MNSLFVLSLFQSACFQFNFFIYLRTIVLPYIIRFRTIRVETFGGAPVILYGIAVCGFIKIDIECPVVCGIRCICQMFYPIVFYH